MRNLIINKRYRRDLKLMRKRGKDERKLNKIINELQAGHQLDLKHRNHPLTGDWSGCWECHVEPDWLLVYDVTENELELIRLGSHSDLFG
jgi:mRNA interferase YafQ